MIVKNKTEVYIKHLGRVFAPKQAIEILDEEVYEHRDFEIEESKKPKKPKKHKKKKGGKK